MIKIDATQLLSQLNHLATQATKSPAAVGAAPAAGGPADFASILGSAVKQVSAQQQSATELATAFDMGTPGVDLTQVMIESQKAALSFRAMSEVRNKLVTAYQDIMNMPL